MTQHTWQAGDIAVIGTGVYAGRIGMVGDLLPNSSRNRAVTLQTEPGEIDTLAYGEQSLYPVVVINPSDRTVVSHLHDLLGVYEYDPTSEEEAGRETLGVALHAFASPTLPEEPAGIGAVVEDVYRQRWVRATNFTSVRHWRGCDESWQGRRRWDEIPGPVRVLTEGVKP